MRIDIGPDGKIIGSRRVSPNGQVSGLSEFSGREVLVILPGTSESNYGSPWPSGDEVTRMVSDQIRQAYERYGALQEAYATPWEATRSFMERAYGGLVPNLMAEVERWIQSQVDPGSAPASSRSTAAPPARTQNSARRAKSSRPRRSGSPGKRRR